MINTEKQKVLNLNIKAVASTIETFKLRLESLENENRILKKTIGSLQTNLNKHNQDMVKLYTINCNSSATVK